MNEVKHGNYWHEWFYYDENSPSGLRWASSPNWSISVGEVAGSLMGSTGYWIVGHDHKQTLCHRIVWEMINGTIYEGLEIDHVDGNRGNNLISNLRVVDKQTNLMNMGMYKNNTSGVNGVYKRCRKTRPPSWVAQWSDLDGKLNHKSFSTRKYGCEYAFLLAKNYRENKIAELVEAGVPYTERHGK